MAQGSQYQLLDLHPAQPRRLVKVGREDAPTDCDLLSIVPLVIELFCLSTTKGFFCRRQDKFSAQFYGNV